MASPLLLFAPETRKSIAPQSQPQNQNPCLNLEEGEIPSELQAVSPLHPKPSALPPPQGNSHPPPSQITIEPPLKRARATPEEPQQGCQNLNSPPMTMTKKYHRNCLRRIRRRKLREHIFLRNQVARESTEPQMGASQSQIDVHKGGEEFSEGPTTEMTPPGDDTRDSETPDPPGTRIQVSTSETPAPPETGTQRTPSEKPAPTEARTQVPASEMPAPSETGTKCTPPEEPAPPETTTRGNTLEEGEIPSTVQPPEENLHQSPNLITNEPPLKKPQTKPQDGCDNLNSVRSMSRSARRRQRARRVRQFWSLKKQATTGCQPDQVARECQQDADTNQSTEVEMDVDNGDEDCLERPATEMAPPVSDMRDSETSDPPETRTQVLVSGTPVPPETRTDGTASETPALPETRTQDTSGCLQKMIPVSVYAGGEVIFNQMGAAYTIPPVVTFPCTEHTTFTVVRSEIYKGLKLSKDQFSLDIQARYNAVSSGPFFFTLLAINNDKAWQMIYKMAVSGMNWYVIELYVILVPNQTSRNDIPTPTTSSIPQCSMPMHSTPSPTMSLNYPMQAYWSWLQHVANPAISPGTSCVAQQFLPMHADPSQTMPHKPLVQGFHSRPNSVPGSYPVMGTRIQHHNRNMHSEASQTKSNNSPLQGICMRLPIPNHTNPSSASTSSMPLWNMPRHGNSSQTMPQNAPVQGSHQNSIPDSSSWFSQGQSSRIPVLNPSAAYGGKQTPSSMNCGQVGHFAK